eukprot:scaffold14521_cov121-Isochrysis_galbana.AAC.13
MMLNRWLALQCTRKRSQPASAPLCGAMGESQMPLLAQKRTGDTCAQPPSLPQWPLILTLPMAKSDESGM